ncbi:hypothetical protein [Lonepinella sp. BR2357]|uniref:hypothetical protein n=1 Tax=Lonepinella sp. BR2357 TaxID=3434549 RepID=UPI003F6DB9D8
MRIPAAKKQENIQFIIDNYDLSKRITAEQKAEIAKILGASPSCVNNYFVELRKQHNIKQQNKANKQAKVIEIEVLKEQGADWQTIAKQYDTSLDAIKCMFYREKAQVCYA